MANVVGSVFNKVKDEVGKVLVDPLTDIVDKNIIDITTTIGSFVVRSVRGKFQRSISFMIKYGNRWMEEALYGILYEYNDIKKKSKLELVNKRGTFDGSGMYYQLDDGTHNLKFRDYDILLVIQTSQPVQGSRMEPTRIYTIITFDLSPSFVTDFEREMISHRNSLLKIKADSPTINLYQDMHESDGYTYWEKTQTVPKRRLNSIYLPREQKKLIVDTVNEFFGNKEYYRKHGIAHNLKILLYGEPGSGKDSIAKMIASEWNRNMYYVTGGKNGKYIPNALTDNDDEVNYPLFLISDIDKYPFIINEPNVEIKDDDTKEETMQYKQTFGAMINALDGVLSGEDKIIIMTTNHIEKFSETFLRPGRIDLKMYITYVTPEVFRQYTHDFYGITLPEKIKLKDEKITIAMLQFDVVFLKLTSDEFIKKYVK